MHVRQYDGSPSLYSAPASSYSGLSRSFFVIQATVYIDIYRKPGRQSSARERVHKGCVRGSANRGMLIIFFLFFLEMDGIESFVLERSFSNECNWVDGRKAPRKLLRFIAYQFGRSSCPMLGDRKTDGATARPICSKTSSFTLLIGRNLLSVTVESGMAINSSICPFILLFFSPRRSRQGAGCSSTSPGSAGSLSNLEACHTTAARRFPVP